MSYSESEPDFSNLSSTSVSIFSESESDDCESDFNSVFMNLGICVFFTLYLHSSLVEDFFYLLSKQNQ